MTVLYTAEEIISEFCLRNTEKQRKRQFDCRFFVGLNGTIRPEMDLLFIKESSNIEVQKDLQHWGTHDYYFNSDREIIHE